MYRPHQLPALPVLLSLENHLQPTDKNSNKEDFQCDYCKRVMWGKMKKLENSFIEITVTGDS